VEPGRKLPVKRLTADLSVKIRKRKKGEEKRPSQGKTVSFFSGLKGGI